MYSPISHKLDKYSCQLNFPVLTYRYDLKSSRKKFQWKFCDEYFVGIQLLSFSLAYLAPTNECKDFIFSPLTVYAQVGLSSI